MNKDRGLNYGIIGNCKSSALINEKSSIDWCCLPQFDSSSVFSKILEKDSGGSLKIECNDDFIISQKYLENTAIIITTFKNDNSENEGNNSSETSNSSLEESILKKINFQ